MDHSAGSVKSSVFAYCCRQTAAIHAGPVTDVFHGSFSSLVPTVSLKIFVPDPYQEFLVAELSDMDFDAFELEDDYLVAYIPSARWDDVKREQIESWLHGNELSRRMTEQVVGDENWNRQWEETIGPIVVEPFLVKPTWREAPSDIGELILLEIDPKMSFGTGYHESTRLMLRLLPAHLLAGDEVLDAGTGTGILAIAAVKLGARKVDGFDIDTWSRRNAVENVYLNGVQDRVTIIEGSIDGVPGGSYDLVLANINLNVVVGLLAEFGIRLSRGGRLVVSGIFLPDRSRLLEAAEPHGFALLEERTEGEWWAAALVYEGKGR
ncbi:MAG: 50S ribosomal protein L11 methyltransferase [Rhodothermales bacterium]